MFKNLFIGLIFLGLCACSSIHYARYEPPGAKQDAAEIFVEKYPEVSTDGKTSSDIKRTDKKPWDETHAEIAAFDQNSCFTGYTYIDNSMRLHANKEAFIYFWQNSLVQGSNNGTCSDNLSFVPEKNIKYKLIAADWYRPTRKGLFGKTISENSCWLKVVKLNEDNSETLVPTKRYKFVEDNKCSRAMPVGGQ